MKGGPEHEISTSLVSSSIIDRSDVPFWSSQRVLMTFLSFLGFICFSMQRANLSIALVCMVAADDHHGNGTDQPVKTIVAIDNASSHANTGLNTTSPWTGYGVEPLPQGSMGRDATLVDINCTALPRSNLSMDPSSVATLCHAMGFEKTDAEFTWGKEFQGILLGAYFWGYLILQVSGGRLSERFGPRKVTFFSQGLVAVSTILSAPLARANRWLLVVARILVGLGGSVLYPAQSDFLNRWSPPLERTRLLGCAYGGQDVGCVLIFPFGGILCATLGWASVFYITGAMGAVWCLAWVLLASNSPQQSTRISKMEYLYLEQEIKHNKVTGTKSPPVPWCSVLRSPPFLAILTAHVCANYGFYLMLTQTPTYLREALKVNVESNGLFSMLPFITLSAVTIGATLMSDLLISKEILSRTAVRKLMTSISFFPPAICFLTIPWLDSSHQLIIIALLCGCVGLQGAINSGFMVNHGEIAPQFAGTLFGVTNLSASIPGIVAPYVVGLVTVNQTVQEWRFIFLIAVGIYVFGGTVYLIFAQARVQPWAVLSDLDMEVKVVPPRLESNTVQKDSHPDDLHTSCSA